MSIKNILFHSYSFNMKCGGITVGFEFCKILDNMGINIRICAPERVANSIFTKYYDNNFNLDETLVMYGETIYGNPLNAKYILRWILAPIGKCSSIETHKSWSKTDLVYYFNAEKKFEINPEFVGNIYKTLACMYINPFNKNYNKFSRKGYCHTIRKSHFHKNVEYIHPEESTEIRMDHTQQDYINIFNKKEIFICYDPLTFLSIIAAMCGCVSVVIKAEDSPTQLEWIQTTVVAQYAKENKIDRLYGVAYGLDEIGWARDTLHLVEEQWIKIKEYLIQKTIIPFIEDLKNIETLKNTVENNYFK